jgi:signal transduction histidine kinase
VADQLAVAIENTRLIKEAADTAALREANRLKDEFVSMVSHELRTPLASIKGYSRTLMATDGDWDEQTRHEFLHIIADESDKLTDLVENLLEMSRIEGGRLPIVTEPIILRRFCKEVVERVGNHYPNLRFECTLQDDLPMVDADPRRVEQVLLNLLQNAAKYSGADIVHVSGEHTGEREVLVSVRDNGVGIAPEHLPYLFSKFYRVEDNERDSTSGTGLGLAISKALVEAQGGRIWVESKPGAGTTFYFTLRALILEGDDSLKGNAPAKPVPATQTQAGS